MKLDGVLLTYVELQLFNDANLSAQGIGQIVNYAERAPQSATYPFITWQLLSMDIEQYLDNSTPADFKLTTAVYDCALYCKKASDRSRIVDALKSILHGLSGNIGIPAVNIRNAFIQSISTFSETDITGSSEQIYRASLTVNITYLWE